MGKLVLLLSFVGISILLIFGLVDPNSPVVWMASTSINFAFVRVILLIALAALLATNPPRNIYLRSFVGLVAIGVASFTLNSTYNNHMKILDSFSLLEFSVCAGITVLEQNAKDAVRKTGLMSTVKKLNINPV